MHIRSQEEHTWNFRVLHTFMFLLNYAFLATFLFSTRRTRLHSCWIIRMSCKLRVLCELYVSCKLRALHQENTFIFMLNYTYILQARVLCWIVRFLQASCSPGEHIYTPAELYVHLAGFVFSFRRTHLHSCWIMRFLQASCSPPREHIYIPAELYICCTKFTKWTHYGGVAIVRMIHLQE
jgi:hypothetical protein